MGSLLFHWVSFSLYRIIRVAETVQNSNKLKLSLIVALLSFTLVKMISVWVELPYPIQLVTLVLESLVVSSEHVSINPQFYEAASLINFIFLIK